MRLDLRYILRTDRILPEIGIHEFPPNDSFPIIQPAITTLDCLLAQNKNGDSHSTFNRSFSRRNLEIPDRRFASSGMTVAGRH
jgi:hypothetical protein